MVGSVFDEYLKQGMTAARALELLKLQDCLTFPQLKSGLFPAANFENLEQDETGMANAWLRDSSCIGLVLLHTEQKDVAVNAVKGVISRLQAIRQSFEDVVASGHAPEDDTKRPPVRFSGQDSDPRYDWANAQNDALGYSLQFIGEATRLGVIQPDPSIKGTVDVLVTYLDVVNYWQDADSGHWEEVKKVNASSIGTVVAGLKAIRDIATDSVKVTALIDRGNQALESILPYESKSAGLERAHDSALVFLVEPQRIVAGDMAEQIIHSAELYLKADHGFKRYVADSYWAPDYREHFQLGNRTADFSRAKDMALRDSYLTPGDEAQWTLIDPLIAAYYARQYQASRKSEDAKKAGAYIARSLKSVLLHTKENGETVWRIPELFFLENGEWVPDDHMGLLWAQANLLYGLQVYQEVFGDSLISVNE